MAVARRRRPRTAQGRSRDLRPWRASTRGLHSLAHGSGRLLGRGGRGHRLGSALGPGPRRLASHRSTAGSRAACSTPATTRSTCTSSAGRASRPALIYDSPVTGTVKTLHLRELRDEVARFAGALRRQGIEKGDRVIIYMPMVPEAVIAMLALRAHRRHPLGRLRRFRRQGAGHAHRRRQADGSSSPPPAASRGAGSIPYKPLLDQRHRDRLAQARRAA